MMGDIRDERGDLVLVDRSVGDGGRSIGGDVAHHFLDLFVGQRGGAQQRQQRDPVGTGNALWIAGPQPTEDRAQKRSGGHDVSVAAARCVRHYGISQFDGHSPAIHRRSGIWRS